MKSIWLKMCGQIVCVKTDVCLMNAASEILILVREDKTHINPSDSESQLIAEAVGAFRRTMRKERMSFS
jgi:hypothetical protein